MCFTVQIRNTLAPPTQCLLRHLLEDEDEREEKRHNEKSTMKGASLKPHVLTNSRITVSWVTQGATRRHECLSADGFSILRVFIYLFYTYIGKSKRWMALCGFRVVACSLALSSGDSVEDLKLLPAVNIPWGLKTNTWSLINTNGT